MAFIPNSGRPPGKLARAIGFTGQGHAPAQTPDEARLAQNRRQHAERMRKQADRKRDRERQNQLPPDATVTLDGERAEAGIDGILSRSEERRVGKECVP